MKPLLCSILPRAPHPSRDGSAIRNFHLLAGLAAEFRVRALVLVAPGAPAGEYPPGVDAEEIRDRGRRFRRIRAAISGAVGGASYPARLYGARRLARAVASAAARERPALFVAHGYHAAAAASAPSPRWIDFHNLESEIWTRVGATSPSALVRAFARRQAPRVAASERALAAAADGVSCVSPREAERLAAAGTASIVVPNGVDLDRYRPRREPPPGKLVFFVGDLSWPPNADGVAWFRRDVWPRIAAAHPDARVEVLGRGAPRHLVALGGEAFRFLGEGGDTRPFWERAAVAIVPLLAGGGTRLKILEAAACGVPVVSTSVGAEGLALEPRSEIALADSPEDFAAAVGRLLADRDGAARQASAARRRVEALYDWRAIGADFAAVLAARAAARSGAP